MKKQKICIIGGNLTGLVTSICLSKLDCDIDLVVDSAFNRIKSNRTVGISENNLHFINSLNISKSFKDHVWACSVMKLYTSVKTENFLEIFELDKNNNSEKVLYMIENTKIMKLMKNKIKKIKSISIKKSKKFYSNFNNNKRKYNLIINCTGYNFTQNKNFFNNEMIKNSYKETAITTILKHDICQNNIARQVFFDDEILAFLPISKNKTSIVWSLKKDIKKNNNIYFRKKIKLYARKYLKNVKFVSSLESGDLNFLIRNKYYLNRTLLFGDALHVLHPFVGQGFNMTLRDLESLKKIISQRINLGLDIGSSDALSDFCYETKSGNFAFSIGTDLLKKFLSLKEIRNNMFKILNKSSFGKEFFFNVANKGLKF